MADETENLNTTETPNAQVPPTPVVLTDEEKVEFFKCFLADKSYEADDVLFGGAIKIRFRSLTVEQSTDVYGQLKVEQQNGHLTTDMAYLTALTCYRLGQSLVSINDEPFQPNIVKTEEKAVSFIKTIYIKQKADVIDAWPVYKLSAYAEAFKAFEDKVIALTKGIADPNFWPAAK